MSVHRLQAIVLCISLVGAFELASLAEAKTLEDYNWLWRYAPEIHDLTPEAVLGSRADFLVWRERFATVIADQIDKVPIGVFQKPTVEKTEKRDGYTLRTLRFSTADGRSFGALLAVPNKVDPTRPAVIALHGHEVRPWGGIPIKLFDDHWWPERWVKAGFVVLAPSHLWYKKLKDIYPKHDYHIVWTRIVDQIVDRALAVMPKFDCLVASGLSSGGLTAAVLMAIREDVCVGVFAGSFQSLDYLRENYRIVQHPNQWDVRTLMSYAPLYALIAPRPVQWQLGRKDTFYPNVRPAPPKSTFFPGTPRGVMTTEVVGQFLMLREIWAKFAAEARLYLHEGGHEYDFDAALRFVEAHKLRPGNLRK